MRNRTRILSLLKEISGRFELDLANYSVLTEAASGYFALTPLLAALGGAKEVLALTRDSKYGKAKDIAKYTLSLARQLGIQDRIHILHDRSDSRIATANIVTNLGFVRPIHAGMIEKLAPTVVIPLMWETWEFRPEDLDLELCRSKGIPVLGTNEHHPELNIFKYLGHVAAKLMYEAELEVFKTTVVIVGSGEFATEANIALNNMGATSTVIAPTDLNTEKGKSLIQRADALLVLEHHDRRILIGESGLISPFQLVDLNPSITILHICGGASQQDIEASGLSFWPKSMAPSGYMSVSTTYVGPKPLIELHAAGLKVGQAMADAVSCGLRGLEAEKKALLDCNFAQGFHGRH